MTASRTTVRRPRRPRPRPARGSRAVGYNYPSVTLTRRRRTVRQDHSNDVHQINLSQGARNPTAMTLAKASLEDQWFRVQGLSRVDTSVGFLPLASRIDADGNRLLPIHVWDITSSPNSVNGVTTYPEAGGWLMQQPVAGGVSCSALNLNSQADGGGTLANTTKWDFENISGADAHPYRKQFHYYTHIKLNLYGVRKRSTRFYVQLIMLKDSLGDFFTAAGTNNEKRKIYDYLGRPLMYNNLNAGDPQTKNDIKILKSYECILGPTMLDEYGGENTQPHIQTVNWFIKHNRIRRYDWRRDNPGPLDPNAAWDEEAGAGHDTRIDPKYRVYLVIRALSPERRTVANADRLIDADPISEPSYDYVIRNKFGQPL